MTIIKTIEGTILKDQKLEYNFQEVLTKKLDEYNWCFDQNIINEIVLWKVNRYAQFDDESIELLNLIKKTTTTLDVSLTKELLKRLLNIKGVKIAIASTILRFKNPSVYQIIDQRVYRIIYWIPMPAIIENWEAIKIYLEYLHKLRDVCNKYKIDFTESDRILYALDKEINWGIKIKY